MTGEFAKCNKCGKLALGEEEIADVFGFRNYRGTKKAQAWCKECRKEGLRAYYEKNKTKETEKCESSIDWDAWSEGYEDNFVIHLSFAEYRLLKIILNKLLESGGISIDTERGSGEA